MVKKTKQEARLKFYLTMFAGLLFISLLLKWIYETPKEEKPYYPCNSEMQYCVDK